MVFVVAVVQDSIEMQVVDLRHCRDIARHGLFDFGVALVGLVIVLLVCGVMPTVYWLWAPLLILSCVLLVGALGIALAAANLFYRDVKYLVEVILTFAIFFTPVLYEASMLGEWQQLVGRRPDGRRERATWRGGDGLLSVVDQLAGVSLPLSAWESQVLPARLPDLTPAMLEGYTAAKVTVEALRRCAGQCSRAELLRALESLDMDLGGVRLAYSPADHSGMKFTDLSIIDKSGRFRR